MNRLSEDQISIDKINFTFDQNISTEEDNDDILDELLEENGESVYQIQGLLGTNSAYLIEVGKAMQIPHILIKEFNDGVYFRINILSTLLHRSDLEDSEVACRLPLLRLQVGNQKNETEIASIIFMFHSFEHIKKKISILELSSTHDNKIPINGYFSIVVFIGGNYHVIKNLKTFPGNKNMLKELIDGYYEYKMDLYKMRK